MFPHRSTVIRNYVKHGEDICYKETPFLFIFGCQLLLIDRLRSCLSSVCWPGAVSSPPCLSGIACPHLSSCQLSTRLWLDASDRIDSWVALKILQASMNLKLEVWQEAKHLEMHPPSWIQTSQVTKTSGTTQSYRLVVLIRVVSTIARTNQ